MKTPPPVHPAGGLPCLASVTMLTVDQVASCLQVAPWTVRDWRKRGEGPPGRKIGGALRYLPAEVAAWIESRPT